MTRKGLNLLFGVIKLHANNAFLKLGSTRNIKKVIIGYKLSLDQEPSHSLMGIGLHSVNGQKHVLMVTYGPHFWCQVSFIDLNIISRKNYIGNL